MMFSEVPVTQKIQIALETLDRLADNPQGRARCGYIWILNEIIEGLKKDIEKGEQNNGCQESDRKEEAGEEDSK